MMGRRLKTTLPTTAELLRPQGQDEVVVKLKKVKETQKHYFGFWHVCDYLFNRLHREMFSFNS